MNILISVLYVINTLIIFIFFFVVLLTSTPSILTLISIAFAVLFGFNQHFHENYDANNINKCMFFATSITIYLIIFLLIHFIIKPLIREIKTTIDYMVPFYFIVISDFILNPTHRILKRLRIFKTAAIFLEGLESLLDFHATMAFVGGDRIHYPSLVTLLKLWRHYAARTKRLRWSEKNNAHHVTMYHRQG